MVKFLGWIGFLLFASTLIPFSCAVCIYGSPGVNYITRYHHSLALTSLAVFNLARYIYFGRQVRLAVGQAGTFKG